MIGTLKKVNLISILKRSSRTLIHLLNQHNYISFPDTESLWKTFTPKRWQVIQEMTGAEAMAIRELARRLSRDVRAVHSDVHALLKCGVLDKTSDGKIEFPYDAVHVDFMVTKAA